jgi:hypothetical protein
MSEPAILDARAEAVLRTWQTEHPRVLDVTVSHVDGAVYRIETPGATFKAEVMDGGTRILFTWSDPASLDVPLGPAVLRRLVGPPEPAPERDASLFDVADARRRSHVLLDRVRTTAERLRIATRHVATSHSDEVVRLGALVPEDAVASDYRPVSHDVTLRRMARECVETAVLLDDLRATLGEAEAFRRHAGPNVRTAVVALETARRGGGALADVGSLASLGEIARDRWSQHQVNLLDLEDRLDRLRRACDEVAPLVSRFESALQTHASAMLHVARLAAVASSTAVLARLRATADGLRIVSEAEVLAAEAAYRLGVGETVPRIIWPDLGSLEAPRLESKSGGK